MLPGTDNTGAVVSRTVTRKVAGCEALWDASVAVQVTVVVPSGNVEPDADEHITTGAASTASVAVGCAYVTTAPAALVASTVTSEGTPWRTGGVVSTTVT